MTIKKYKIARKNIGDMDLLLFQGKGIVSHLIKTAGRSKYSHVGSAAWWGATLFCLEIREFKGGRAVTLSSQVEKCNIDVFKIKQQFVKDYDREAALECMKRLCGIPYGWYNIWRTSLLHLPVIRFFTRPNFDDDYIDKHYPNCSNARSFSDKVGGGIDPVEDLANNRTEPGDLARSNLYEYAFTLSM